MSSKDEVLIAIVEDNSCTLGTIQYITGISAMFQVQGTGDLDKDQKKE